ncbi:MAG: energy transducer TonB [Cyclobacteriaceae bacterium]|nr:energy transducer TonB [Cyclobacteriaceae bacterium]
MKNIKSFAGAMMAALLCLAMWPAQAQSKYGEIENTQDKIEDLYLKVYTIVDDYPHMTHEYIYDGDKLTGVRIDGVDNKRAKDQLEIYLVDLENLKRNIYNQSNRFGIYYTTETEPKPKMGYRDFYSELQSNLSYPERAKDNNVEGTVFVKFVVDHNGEISFVKTAEDIEAPMDYIVDAMKEEAKEAVLATSGQWEPAKIGGVPVAEWMLIPVQFKLEDNSYFLSPL